MQAPRKEFVTPKGTKLDLLNLKGKEYLPVAQRLIWFREEKPEWAILTTVIHVDDNKAIVQALICNEKGERRAMAHKAEHQKHFPDFMEKAETGAIGRALALCGYGTQFTADELDEGERIVDSPRQPAPVTQLRGGAKAGPIAPPPAKKTPPPAPPEGPSFDDFPGGPLPS